MIITEIIDSYLQSHNRLIVGGLGTFLKKESSEELFFSEFLKDDDGVLHSLLVERGMNEIEAAGVIDRFVFEVRYALNDGEGSFYIPNIGTLTKEMHGGVKLIIERNSIEQPPTIEIEEQTQEATTPQSTTMEELFTIEPQTPQEVDEEVFDPATRRSARTKIEAERGDTKLDLWLIIPIVVVLLALFVLGYGFIVEWQLGNIELPEWLDSILRGVF